MVAAMSGRRSFSESPLPGFEPRVGAGPVHARAAASRTTARRIACACGSGFWRAARTAVPDYELLEMILYRALPRGDTKPLAKDCSNAFGDLNHVLAAPPARLWSMTASATW